MIEASAREKDVMSNEAISIVSAFHLTLFVFDLLHR